MKNPFDWDDTPKTWQDGERDAAIGQRWRGFLLRHGASYTQAVKAHSYHHDAHGTSRLGWPQRMSYDMALNQRLRRSPLNRLCEDPIVMPHVTHRWLQGLELTLQWPNSPANCATLQEFVRNLRDGDLARHLHVKQLPSHAWDEIAPDEDGEPMQDAQGRCGLVVTGVDMEAIRRRLNRLMHAVPGASEHPLPAADYEIRRQDIGQPDRAR